MVWMYQASSQPGSECWSDLALQSELSDVTSLVDIPRRFVIDIKDLRLGMPLYHVSGGSICVSYVTAIEFVDQDDISSEIRIDIKGSFIPGGLTLTQLIDRQSVDWAIDEAKRQLELMLQDDTRTMEEDRKWMKRRHLMHGQGSSELPLDQHKCDLRTAFCRVQPMDHFPLGAMLWYVQPDLMTMLVGHLARVDSFGSTTDGLGFGKIQYKNGQYLGQTKQQWFFDHKKTALDALAAHVEKRYPVMLNRDRVRVFPTQTLKDKQYWFVD